MFQQNVSNSNQNIDAAVIRVFLRAMIHLHGTCFKEVIADIDGLQEMFLFYFGIEAVINMNSPINNDHVNPMCIANVDGEDDLLLFEHFFWFQLPHHLLPGQHREEAVETVNIGLLAVFGEEADVGVDDLVVDP